MNVFKLAATNVRRNFSNYAVYFVSVVFNVTIYYMFVSIRFNQQIAEVVAADENILATVNFASIMIALFSAVFIWYSSSFFLQRRKQEIGLYALLGIRKRIIGLLMFSENMLIGLMALGIGIGLGTLFSKLLMMLLLKVMGIAKIISFSVSVKAILYTVLVFGLLFLLTSFLASGVIYRYKLIELFTAAKEGQRPVKTSRVGALLALVILVAGYAVGLLWQQETFIFNMALTLLLSVVGTFLFFRYVMGAVMNMLRQRPALYLHRMNLIDISQFVYRIRSNGRMLSLITILTAVALTSVGTTYGLNYHMQALTKISLPFSFSYVSNDPAIDRQVEQAIAKYPRNQLLKSAEAVFVPVGVNITQIPNSSAYLMSESDYHKVATVKGIEDNVSLSGPNDSVLLYYGIQSYDSLIGEFLTVAANRQQQTVTVVDWQPAPAMNVSQLEHVLVVKDELYHHMYSEGSAVRAKGYIIENPLDSRNLTKDLIRIVPTEASLSTMMERSGVLNWMAILNFIGVLLGLVFLLSTGSIIYFKQLMEAWNDRQRYDILRKIGVTQKEVKRSVSRQMLLLFALPLVLGSCHYLVAMRILSAIFPNANFVVPTLTTLTGYVVIYLGYYLLTTRSYYGMVMTK